MFTHDYLIFDELGIEQVKCMSCAKPIKTRKEVKSRIFQDRVIRELVKHADYREIPVILEDGKLAFIMVCDDCKFVSIGEKESKDISEQLKRALKLQLEFEGKLPDVIEEILKMRNYTVLRKAEVSEITAVLRGC